MAVRSDKPKYAIGSEFPDPEPRAKNFKVNERRMNVIRDIVDTGFISEEIYVKRRMKAGVSEERAREEYKLAKDVRQ